MPRKHSPDDDGRTTNLRQLAALLGLSQTTVSRALNGFPEVSERTRKRVEAAAIEHDYRPSSSATALATGRAMAVGHLVPLGDHRMINPHFSDFLSGAGDAYAEAGYDLLMRTVDPLREGEVMRDLVRRRRVDGLVIHGPRVEEPRIAAVQALAIPFIVHGRTHSPIAPYSFLDVDNEGALDALATGLIERGHRRIAFVNGLCEMTFAHDRLAGFRAAHRRAGLRADDRLLRSADMTEPFGHAATRSLLARAEPPSAIIYGSSLLALGGLRALAQTGRAVGSDVSVALYDDDLSFLRGETRDAPFAGLSSARSSLVEAGRHTASLLLGLIERPRDAPRQHVWQPRIVWTDSVRSPAS